MGYLHQYEGRICRYIWTLNTSISERKTHADKDVSTRTLPGQWPVAARKFVT